MKYVTYAELRTAGQLTEAQAVFKSAAAPAGKNVFLSHSSADHDLLPGVALTLERHGGRPYIDELDPGVSGDDFEAIAGRLRDAVARCPKFVLFVSKNTASSRWIPWELGLSDGAKSLRNVALFPAAERAADQGWANQEYLGLYPRIVTGRFKGSDTEEWMVWNHRDNTASRLREWLAR